MSANRLVLIASQAAGQLSIVLATPFLTRLFAPDELGRFHLAFTLGILLQPFLTLRYESIIPSEKVEAAIPQYVRLVAVASAFVTGFLGIMALAGAALVSQSFARSAVMIGIVAATYAGTAIDNALLIRQKEMNRLALRNFLSGALVAILQVLFAYVLRDVFWVAVAILVGRLAAIILTRAPRRKSAHSLPGAQVVRFDWGRTVYRVSADLVASLSLNAMVLYSQVLFGPSATAYVGMAQRSATAPLGLISQALSQSVQATVGEAVRVGDQRLLYQVHRQLMSLLPLSVLATVGLFLLGPALAVPVFGQGWETTGEIIAVLAIPAGLQLLISPISPVFFMLGAERQLFRVQVYRLLVSVLFALLFQVLFYDLVVTVAGYSIGTSFGYIYTYIALKKTIVEMHHS